MRRSKKKGREDNPFVLPENRFSIQSNSKLKQREKLREFYKKSIAEKSRPVETRQVIKSHILPSRRRAKKALMEKSHAVARTKMMEYKDQEDLHTFLAKKRQMRLTNMQLSSKRAEMKKLEEKVRLKEEALHHNRVLLEEDSLRFDAFLKEMHIKLEQVDKKLKDQEEIVNSKDEIIKKLKAEIKRNETSINNQREILTIERKYKAFLEELSPAGHLEKVRKNRQELVPKILEAEPCVEEDDVEIDDNMYFTDPAQLRKIFINTEEDNLFTVKLLQENEGKLEDLRKTFNREKEKHDEKTRSIDAVIDELESKLAKQHAKFESMHGSHASERGDEELIDRERLFKKLTECINAMYTELLPPGTCPDVEVMDQLRKVEIWMDKLLMRADAMNPHERKKAEKKVEIEKRKVQVKKMQKEKQRIIEERKNKANARIQSNLSTPGKPMMRRSTPLHLNRRSKSRRGDHVSTMRKTIAEKKANEEYRKFFTTEPI